MYITYLFVLTLWFSFLGAAVLAVSKQAAKLIKES